MDRDYCRRCMAFLQAFVFLIVLVLAAAHLRITIGGLVSEPWLVNSLAVIGILTGVQLVIVYYRWKEIKCR